MIGPPSADQAWVREMVLIFLPVWARNKLDSGCMNTKILLEGREPPPQTQYQVHKEIIAPVTDILKTLEARGIATFKCNSPAWPVKKPNGPF